MNTKYDNIRQFKRPKDGSTTSGSVAKKAKKIQDHLVDLLQYASQDLERVQSENDAEFSKLVGLCEGSYKQAKLQFIADRFEEVIEPWLEKLDVDTNIVSQFKRDMLDAYDRILDRASTNPESSVSIELASEVKAILAKIDMTSAPTSRYTS